MKKLLLMTTAIAGVAFLASPAHAEIDLNLAGYFTGYVVDTDNNVANDRSIEMRRGSGLNVTGETVLDNGLTVGAYGQITIAEDSAAVAPDEIYAYFSGAWGRANFGIEDGSAYLLQVAAPSADPNIDGLRAFIDSLTATDYRAAAGALHIASAIGTGAFDLTDMEYDHADFQAADRITYMTPKFNGFQAGVSYTPTTTLANTTGDMSSKTTTTGTVAYTIATGVVSTAATAATYKDAYEVSARYDGEFQGFGFGVGAGYSDSAATNATVADDTSAVINTLYVTDGVKTYNAGLNVTFQGFSLGGNYVRSKTEYAQDGNVAAALGVIYGDVTRTTYVVGGAYDNGPYHVGVSYLNREDEADALDGVTAGKDIAATKFEDDRYTIGGGYGFGPGMTFRGSVSWGQFASTTTTDTNYRQIAVGAEVLF